MEKQYGMIFRRKSVRKYDPALRISETEMREIEEQLKDLVPLDENIRVRFKIVKSEETTARKGEYCLLIYSEKKGNYLLNAGYLLEQMDLFLESNDIGVCWYGMAKPDVLQCEGLDYVIMLGFGKSRPEDFRKSVSEFKRKDRETIWSAPDDPALADAARLAPSACNTQPWRVLSDENIIQVCRVTSELSIIPPSRRPFYHGIDLGIFLCFLELALCHGGYAFERTLCEGRGAERDLIEVADYTIHRKD